MIESYDLVDAWLYQSLTADSQLTALVGSRIGGELVAEQWVGPYVTWNVLSGQRHVRSISGELLDTDGVWSVVAVTRSASYAQAAQISGRLRAVLDNRNVTVTGGTISCYAEGEIRMAEAVEGVQYRHLGWSLRIRAAAI